MGVPRFGDVVAGICEAALSAAAVGAEHLPVGMGNENWRVDLADGQRTLVKFAPSDLTDKRSASLVAYDNAQQQGVPTPRVLHVERSCAAADGSFVQILSWIDGASPESLVRPGAPPTTFFSDLGRALRRLHGYGPATFSSRLDESAPVFDSWSDYVAHRLPAIRARLHRTNALPVGDAPHFVEQCSELAQHVDAVVSPAICHRDLHFNNLLAAADGSLAGIIDFDGAEVWDPAADFVKPRWILEHEHPDRYADLWKAYTSGDAEPRMWMERCRLVDLLELVNAIANARLDGDKPWEQKCRQRLATLNG